MNISREFLRLYQFYSVHISGFFVLLKILIAVLRFKAARQAPHQFRRADASSILVVELTRLGDVISMLPALRMLSVHFPQARIHFLVNDHYSSFLKSLEFGVEVHGVPNPDTLKGFRDAVVLARGTRPDIALSMSPPKRNAAVVLASGAPGKVGYLTYVDSLAPYLESTPVDAFGVIGDEQTPYGMENIEERSMKVCRMLGVHRITVPTEIQFRGEVYESTKRRLEDLNIIPSGRYIVVHPFSGWEFREWSIERFNSLVESIITRLSLDVVFVSAQDEVRRLDSSWTRFNGRSEVRFFSSNDLVETSVVMKEAALVVCNDSGPLHLAAALGTKVVGLFGPAEPRLTAPRNAAGTFLYRKVDCSPCDQCRCVRPENPCMDLLPEDEVFQSVVSTLESVPVVQPVANA